MVNVRERMINGASISGADAEIINVDNVAAGVVVYGCFLIDTPVKSFGCAQDDSDTNNIAGY